MTAAAVSRPVIGSAKQARRGGQECCCRPAAFAAALFAFGCAARAPSISAPASPRKTGATPSSAPELAPRVAPAVKRSIKVLLSTASDQDFCNGEVMDSAGYRNTLTREQELTLPTPACGIREDIRAVLDATTTGMCNTVMKQLDIRIAGDELHIPPISGWAGVSIVMCHCVSEVEVNLVRLPGIRRVVWEAEQTYSFKTTYPDAQAVTASAWRRQHGALGPLRDDRCWDLPQGVGVPSAPALLCWHTADAQLPEYISRIYRLEGKSLRQVWQGTIATSGNWLDLTPIVADDGASLVVHDRREGSCEGALAEAHAKIGSSVDVPWVSAIARGCQQRGKWEYRGNQFVQVEKVSASDPFF